MPISPPVYQLKFNLDLPEEESNSALSGEEIQARKDVARAMVENPRTWPKDENGNPQKPYWWDFYVKLSIGRWPFRVAVLIAWLATPRAYRWPETQDKLADLLGLSSDRQFSEWRANNPQIDAMVHEVWKERALDRLSDSMEAMFQVAAMVDYKGRGDRELHFKIAEILSDKVILDKAGNVDLSKLSFEEKLKMAGLDSPEALLAFRREITSTGFTSDEQAEGYEPPEFEEGEK